MLSYPSHSVVSLLMHFYVDCEEVEGHSLDLLLPKTNLGSSISTWQHYGIPVVAL